MPFPNEDTQFKPGQSGNPAGKAKGTKHLSTLIQELEHEIDWELTQIKTKSELSKQYGKQGMRALVYVAFSKAMSGDTRAMEWLAKHGYGEKLQLEVYDVQRDVLKKYMGAASAREAKENEGRSSASDA